MFSPAMRWIGCNLKRCGALCPGSQIGLVGREPAQGLEPLGEVVGIEEGCEMRSQLVVAVVVIAPDGGVLERAVHALDLTVGPWVVRLGEAMLDVVLRAGVVEGVDAEQLRPAHASLSSRRRPMLRRPWRSVNWMPLSVSTVWIV